MNHVKTFCNSPSNSKYFQHLTNYWFNYPRLFTSDMYYDTAATILFLLFSRIYNFGTRYSYMDTWPRSSPNGHSFFQNPNPAKYRYKKWKYIFQTDIHLMLPIFDPVICYGQLAVWIGVERVFNVSNLCNLSVSDLSNSHLI